MSTFGNNWNVKHNFNILRDGDGDGDADAGVTPIALLILRKVELKRNDFCRTPLIMHDLYKLGKI